MANGSREIRVSIPIALALLGALASTAAGAFTWHAAQRERLEDRLLLVLQDAVYTISQRDDRQDLRRAQLFDIVIKRLDDYGARTERLETMILEEALKSLVRGEIEAEVPKAVEEALEE